MEAALALSQETLDTAPKTNNPKTERNLLPDLTASLSPLTWKWKGGKECFPIMIG